jgi:hypothetical protein
MRRVCRTGLGWLGGLVVLAGCAAIVRTEGTSGPVAWRATDFAIVNRTIQGQSVDTYDFTLVITNAGDRPLTFTRMERIVYQAGGGQPGRTNTEGRWRVEPGREWKVPLYSYHYCSASQGCLTHGGAQPIWQISLTGTDANGRPVESRFEIMPPPQPTPSVDLSINRRFTPDAARPTPARP